MPTMGDVDNDATSAQNAQFSPAVLEPSLIRTQSSERLFDVLKEANQDQLEIVQTPRDVDQGSGRFTDFGWGAVHRVVYVQPDANYQVATMIRQTFDEDSSHFATGKIYVVRPLQSGVEIAAQTPDGVTRGDAHC